MRGIQGIWLAVAATAVIAGSALWPLSAAAGDRPPSPTPTTCRVGTPAPSSAIGKNPYGGRYKLSVPPTVVGCGRSRFGRIILVGYAIKHPGESCFGVYVPRLGALSGGECKAQHESWTARRCPTGFCIVSALGVDDRPKSGFRATVVGGISMSPLKHLQVIVRQAGNRRGFPATVGSISGGLAERFGQREPFVVFGTAVPCVAEKAISAEARDGTERLTATAPPYPELFKHVCHQTPSPEFGR